MPKRKKKVETPCEEAWINVCDVANTVKVRPQLLNLFYVLLTVHLNAILGNDQLDARFLNVFILRLYMFRAASAHHQEGQIVLIHHLV
jgi:hypothetical protein